MEEKKAKGFSSVDELFEWWVEKLTRETEIFCKKVIELSSFESQVQQSEFKLKVDRLTVGFVRLLIEPDKIKLSNGRFGDEINGAYGICGFLGSCGLGFENIARQISEQFPFLLEEISKIRRIILYPEIAEMEEENAKLKINIQAADDRWRMNEYLLENERNIRQGMETQLAEKEKEIGEFDAYIQSLQQDLGPFHSVNRGTGQLNAIRTEINVLLHNKGFWNHRIKELEFQIVEKEKEIAEWKCRADEYQSNWFLTMNDERYPKQLAEKEKEIEELKNNFKSEKEILNSWIKETNCWIKEANDLKSQLAALQKEHDELEKQHSDRGVYLAEEEKEIAGLHDAIEKAIIALDQTKKIFKSPTIGRIRQDLIEALPYGKSKKFISGFTLRIKQIEEEKLREGTVQKGGVNDPPPPPMPGKYVS